jgi:hypothetical protein
MAVYSKLLLSADGGIISATQQSEQENCAVLAVGLGGTGVSCLENLKGKVYNRLKPDDPEAVIPEYRHIKFLAIESDKSGLKDGVVGRIDVGTELEDISNPNISAAFAGGGGILETRAEFKDWLRNSEISIDTAARGAGGNRQVGRFLFIDRSDVIAAKLDTLLTQAQSGLINPSIYIHIFAGISGGTGSGTFLDFSYLLQYVLGRKGLLGRAQTFGYFFLPDVNLSDPAIPDKTKKYIRMNGYAAMKELDYCMSFPENGDAWRQIYKGNISVESNEAPVKLCFLVTAQTSNGNVIDKPYEYAMNVVSDFVMDFLVKDSSTNDDGTRKEFTLDSHISDILTSETMILRHHGARYKYGVLGASSTQIPLKEIMTYLASELFHGFARIKENVPTPSDVDKFVLENRLGYDQLRQAFESGADLSFPKPDIDIKTLRDEGNHMMVDHFKHHQGRIEGVFDRNGKAMLHPLDDYVASTNIESVICRIFQSLSIIMRDPARGVFYAARLLYGANSRDLRNVIDGHIAENAQRLAHESAQATLRDSEYETAKSTFEVNPNKKNFKAYEFRCQMYVRHQTIINEYSKMNLLLTDLKKQITDLSAQYTAVFERVMATLIDTFNTNKSELDQLAPAAGDYVSQLMTIGDLKPSLDAVIKAIDVPGQITDFISYLQANAKAWQAEDENEIARVVNRFFNTVFSTYSSKTISDYLKEKYQSTNLQVIQQNVRTDIMDVLNNKAAPLFWTAGAVYSLTEASTIAYCSVPSACPEIISAAQSLKATATDLKLRKVNLVDRISIFRFICGVPLYGYQGIGEYEDVYNDNMGFVGRHLYEGKNGGKDWSRLAPPKSYSVIKGAGANAQTIKTTDGYAELYEQAKSLGIVFNSDVTNYFVRLTDDGEVRDIVSSLNAAIATGDPIVLKTALNAAEAKRAALTFVKSLKLQNDGNGDEEVKERVRKDHFIAYLELRDAAKKEIDKLTSLQEIFDKAERTITAIIDSGSAIDDFTNALFTGVVTVTGPKVEYSYDDFGITESGVLSMPTAPRGKLPLYQAFINFKELPGDIKSKLKELADERQNAVAPELTAATQGINNLLNQVYMKLMQDNARSFVDEYEDIVQFFKDVRKKVNDFASMFAISL